MKWANQKPKNDHERMNPHRKDELGNIHQKDGGVVPKFCQVCKKPFGGKIEETPIIQKIFNYKCECGYETDGDQSMLNHIQDTKSHDGKIHKFTKTSKDRIVATEKIHVGSVARISFDNNKNPIIKCDRCM